MKDIKAQRAGAYLTEMIQQGEHVQQDFKFLISDAHKIARSISAFANCEGGRLLIGVKDNGSIAGVRNEEDIYVIEQAAQLYCRPAQDIEFTAFRTPTCQVVIRASVAKAVERPVLAQEPDHSWRAYYRVADENIAAHGLMVRTWRHIASGRRSTFHIDGPENRIMEHLRLIPSPVAIDEAIVASGASRRAAEWAIIRLAALGLIEFNHSGSVWGIHIPE